MKPVPALPSPNASPELTVTDGGTPDTPAEADVAPAEGRLGRFILLRLLGEGGMGVVYTAWDELLDRRVALKLVRTDHDGDAYTRMLHEAKGLARLSHPHVVQIYEVSAAAGRLFIAMEYVAGSTLRAWTAAQRQAGADLRTLLDMYVQAGRGLAAAHAQGLVHRDFKPDNVLVGDDGRARVVDFGLVALRDAPHDSEGAGDAAPLDAGLTRRGAVLGTPAYMSPEQFAGGRADARSDQFSFCVALWEALCGARPFAGGTFAELRASVVAGPPPEPARPLPAWLLATLRRGLARRPEDRFPGMDELLTRLAHDPEAGRRRRRSLARLAFGAAVVAAVLVLLALDLRRRWSEHQRERSAELARAAAETRIREALAADHPAAARETFAAFVDDPLHEGTEALALAWLDEADRRRAAEALGDARSAYAAAYAAAPTEPLQTRALHGLAYVFARRLEWRALANLLALVDRRHAAVREAFAGLRIDAALARRDLAGARDPLAGTSHPLAALGPALLPATATRHRRIEEIQVGDDDVLLVERRAERLILHLARADAALTTTRELPLPPEVRLLALTAGDPRTVVAYDPAADLNTVYRVEPAALVPLHRWTGPRAFAGARADLDGDGERELYFGTGVGLEVIVIEPTPAGGYTTRVVYDPTDTLDSLAHGLVAVDLDDDGRQELAASFTGWRAYDVRILARAPGGRLRTVDRDKLGTVYGLAPLRTAGGPRLVAKNLHRDEAPLVFPPDHPHGETEGLYLYGFDGRHLVRRGHLPLRLPVDGNAAIPWAPSAGDVDGDGREDIAIGFAQSGAEHTLLHLQGADGDFTPALLGHLQLLGLAQLDDDPAVELIAGVSDPDGTARVWVLGAGEDTLPTAPVASGPADALVDPEDPAWTRQWRQAADLNDLGLEADAATAFEKLARRSAGPDLRAHAALSAGRLRARTGQLRVALALLRDAARAPALAAVARREALALELRLGDHDAAQASVAALQTEGVRDDALARLAAVSARARSEQVALRFAGPLDPAWWIGDPLGLRHEPGDDALELATNGDGVLLSLPVDWSGDLVELAVDMELDELEYGARLEFSLRSEADPAAAPLAGLGFGMTGTFRGGLAVTRRWLCTAFGRELDRVVDPAAAVRTAEAVRLDLRVSVIPALDELGCEAHERLHDVRTGQREPLAGPLPPPGRYHLDIAVRGGSFAWLRARLYGITLRGVRLAVVPEGPRAFLHRALVAADFHATLAALDTDTTDRRDQVWRAHALLQIGRGEEARRLLAGLLVGPAPAELLLLLRAHPELYAPLLAELAGDRYPALVQATWRAAATNHLDDPRPRRALQAVLAPLDADALLATADPDALAVACDLLRWRAEVRARTGDISGARLELERVLAATARLPADSPQSPGRWVLWLELASLAAREGRVDDARSAVGAALAAGPMPALVGDIVRARPELAPLVP